MNMRYEQYFDAFLFVSVGRVHVFPLIWNEIRLFFLSQRFEKQLPKILKC